MASLYIKNDKPAICTKLFKTAQAQKIICSLVECFINAEMTVDKPSCCTTALLYFSTCAGTWITFQSVYKVQGTSYKVQVPVCRRGYCFWSTIKGGARVCIVNDHLTMHPTMTTLSPLL